IQQRLPKSVLLDGAFVNRPRGLKALVDFRDRGFVGLNRHVVPIANELELAGVTGGGDAARHFEKTLRGQLAHELAHVILPDLPANVRTRLVRHAKLHKVLDVQVADWFLVVGRPDLAANAPDMTRRQQYEYLYQNASNKDSLIEEEYVTHLV